MAIKDIEFEVGDVVRIRTDSVYYQHDSISNPKDKTGRVTGTNDNDHPDPHPIEVQWDEHISNVYRSCDIEHAYMGVLWT